MTELKWIPAKDQLPPKNKLLLCCGIKGGMFLGYLGGRNVINDLPTARINGEGAEYRTINAWMIAPPPFVDEEESKAFLKRRMEYLSGRKVRKKDERYL